MNNINRAVWQIWEALKFYFQASTIYNVHSPFLYSILKSAYQDNNIKQPNWLKSYRSRLHKNNELITEEVGAGSNSFGKNTISKALKISSSNYSKSSLIAKIARALNAKSIIELGTNLGLTTTTLAIYNPKSTIRTVEANEQLLRKAKNFFDESKLDNIIAYSRYFDEFLVNELDSIKADFIFIDGDHNFKSTLKYYNSIIKEKKQDQLCLIFDDIRWSKDMYKAWTEIISETDSSIVVDFYNMGIIVYSPKLTTRLKYKIINHKFKPFNLGLFVKNKS